MQGKAELVDDVLALLQEFYRDKLKALIGHIAGSRGIPQYDANNAYQYIVNREEVQLSWLRTAIAELGGSVPEGENGPPQAPPVRRASQAILEDDARGAQAFVDKWRPRVEAMTNARHRGMLRVVLGETLEQKRSFDQALAGQTDLLGKRSEQVGPRVGHVLPERWIE
jgi:hypothetical protein